MSKLKIHYFEWGTKPNESDPQGDEYVICWTQEPADGYRGSHNKDAVTCEHCLDELKCGLYS